ncbi:MAG: TonB-dependent receptor plug domain-containing protein [Opitutaceae bacterium]|nr:TonB-dependent receptor plug domain-containing protein [Opitutaceae bacterium]
MPKYIHPILNTLARKSALAVFAFASLAAFAQTTPAPPPPDTGDEDQIVVLSPFSVNAEKDRGYLAADTLTGGRMATNLLTTPGDISVQTREFLNDIAANTLSDAYKWMPNATVAEPPAAGASNANGGDGFTFRGLPSGGNARNYFAGVSYPLNEFIVERIEQLRGPASILYGQSWSGGAVNIVTKKALFGRNMLKVDVKGDSEGSERVSVDANYGKNKYVALRINATDQRLRNFVDTYFDDLRAGDVAVTVRPWKGSEIRVEAETGVRKIVGSPAPYGYIMDNMSDWDGAGVWMAHPEGITAENAADWAGVTIFTGPMPADTVFATSQGVGITNWNGISTNLSFSPLLGGKALDFSGYGAAYGTGITIAPAKREGIPGLPSLPKRDFSPQPSDNQFTNHMSSLQAFWSQTWNSGLAVELSASFNRINRSNPHASMASWGNMKIDINQYLPDGSANPGFLKVYSDTNIINGKLDNGNSASEVRLNVLYPVRFGWGTQTFALLAQNSLSFFHQYAQAYARLSNKDPDAIQDPNHDVNLVLFRQYWDLPNLPLVLPASDSYGNPLGWVPRSGMDQRTQLRSIQLGTVGQYFGDKITLIAGMRRDLYHFEQNDLVVTNGVKTGHTRTEFSRDANTTAIGATYFPVKTIGFLLNYSGGFQPNTITYPFFEGGSRSYVTTSRVLSYGLRFNLLGGKVVGSFGYYKSKEQGRLDRFPTYYLRTIWQYVNEPERDPFPNDANYHDTFAYNGRGFEVDLVGNLSRDFRLTANLALPETEYVDAMPASKAYLAEHEAYWQSKIPGNADGWRVRDALQNWKAIIDATDKGRAIGGTFDWKANIWGVYTIPTGTLKGVRIGGGANMAGPRIIGNQLGAPKDYIKMDAYAIASLMASYNFKIGRASAYFQVNVDNLFNYYSPIFNSVGMTSGNRVAKANYPNGFYYIPPRMVRFQLTLTY